MMLQCTAVSNDVAVYLDFIFVMVTANQLKFSRYFVSKGLVLHVIAEVIKPCISKFKKISGELRKSFSLELWH